MTKNQTGIWMDSRKAFIIQLKNDDWGLQQLNSKIEEVHALGGSRGKTAWGPTEKVSESKFLARRLQQEKMYFNRLFALVKNTETFLLFGPGETKNGFAKYVEQQSAPGVNIVVKTADSMSSNQMVAFVRDHFSSSTSKL